MKTLSLQHFILAFIQNYLIQLTVAFLASSIIKKLITYNLNRFASIYKNLTISKDSAIDFLYLL